MKDINTFKQLIKILNIISYRDKLNCLLLILLSILTSLFELFSVYLIIPVYKILIDEQRLEQTLPWFKYIANNLFDSLLKEQLFTLLFFGIVYVVANLFKTYVVWFGGRFTGQLGANLYSSAYSKVLSQPYESLLADNISRYSSNFLVTSTYFIALLRNLFLLVNYATTAILLILALIIFKPLVTILSMVFLLLPYFIITIISKPFLIKNSKQIAFLQEDINRYIQEGFSSIKTIKHFNVQDYYENIFFKSESKLREKVALGEFIEQYPRYFLESLLIVMIIFIYSLSFFNENIDSSPVFLVALIFASLKILPSIQQIYRIWSYVIGRTSSINDLYECLFEKKKFQKGFTFDEDKIIFKNVSYSYPKQKDLDSFEKDNKKIYVLENINLKIDYPASISITGDSGCGKTTFIDLLTGLISPSRGSISLPKEFQNYDNVGYVPQEVPIINGSFLNNITLGKNLLKGDSEYLSLILNLVRLDKYIKSYPKGLNTILGEQSLNLSGGQKQRLGIARALFKRPKLLVLDESTNALDKKNENYIIKNLLSQFSNCLIIIITHNENISNQCKYNLHFDFNGELKYLDRLK